MDKSRPTRFFILQSFYQFEISFNHLKNRWGKKKEISGHCCHNIIKTKKNLKAAC